MRLGIKRKAGRLVGVSSTKTNRAVTTESLLSSSIIQNLSGTFIALLSPSQTHPTEAGKLVLRYLQGTRDLGMHYRRGDMNLIGFSDSDYAGDKLDRKSTSGFLFFLGPNLITWSSQKQQIVSCSSTEAEYVALHSAARESVWLAKHLGELGLELKKPPLINVDNQSAIKLSQNPEFHKRTKHIDTKYHYTRELIAAKQLELNFIPTQDQAADGLTKPLQKSKHKDMVTQLKLETMERSSSNSAIKMKRSAMWSLFPLLIMMTFMITSASASAVGKTLCRKPSPMPLLLVHFIGLLISTTGASNQQPVLWRPTSTPVTTGHQLVFLRIKLFSP